jgi:hypothetical protein
MSKRPVKLMPLMLYLQQIYGFASRRIRSLPRMWLAVILVGQMLRANGDEKVM